MLLRILNILSEYGDPEQFHELSMKFLSLNFKSQNLINTFPKAHHLKWKNPIGLAAGFDKNGEYLNALSKMGFGALEVGTVTPLFQAGNLRPRIKKINAKKSILNWMGFPSQGMHQVYKNLKNFNQDTPLGINIGKNKATPNSKAIDDYLKVALKLSPFAHYFTINISSPNTPGLRDLQNSSFLEELLTEFKSKNIEKIFIKISPDLSDNELKDLAKLADHGILKGFIATNTTNHHSFLNGGISGELLKERAFQTVKKLTDLTKDAPIDIVACGGISDPNDILKYQKIGIKLFQIYSSFIYQGPRVIDRLMNYNQGIENATKR